MNDPRCLQFFLIFFTYLEMMCLEQKIGKESQLIAQFQTHLYTQLLQLQKKKNESVIPSDRRKY